MSELLDPNSPAFRDGLHRHLQTETCLAVSDFPAAAPWVRQHARPGDVSAFFELVVGLGIASDRALRAWLETGSRE